MGAPSRAARLKAWAAQHKRYVQMIALAGAMVGMGSTAAAVCSCSTPTFPSSPNFTANVFLAPGNGSNGNTACAPAGSPVTYAAAVTGGNVCYSLYKACSVAAGGIVGVKAGVYPDVPGGSTLPNGQDGFAADCGSGAADYDPNCGTGVGLDGTTCGNLNGWATFECADGNTSSAQFSGTFSQNPNVEFDSNAHADFEGGCFSFHYVFFGFGGETGLKAENIILHGVTQRIHLDGSEIRGGKNIKTSYVEVGDDIQCNATGVGVASTRCSASGPSFEAAYANSVGNASRDGFQWPWVGRNTSGASIHIRVDDAILHDDATRSSTSWHGGCGHILDQNGVGANGTDNANASNNVVINAFTCYRVNTFGIFLENANGTTVMNSAFGVPANNLDVESPTPFANWFEPVTTQTGIQTSCQNGNTSLSNDLFLYDSVVTSVNMRSDQCTGGYTNVKVEGTIIAGGGASCDAGVTWDYNAYGDAGCSADTHKFANISSPFTTDSRTTIAYPPSTSDYALTNVGFDPTLTAGTKTFEHQLPTTGDFALSNDINGNARPASGQTLNTAGAVSR